MMDKNGESRGLFDLRDVFGILGLSLVTGGIAMMHIPAALIVSGAILLVGAIMAARR